MITPEQLQIKKPNKKLLEQMNSVDLKEETIFEKESFFHNLKVVKSPVGIFLKYLETYQAGFINTKYYKGNLPYINYFLIPYLMNKNIKDILFIGFGSGRIINQYEKIFENLKRIDIVDLEENIFEIAHKYFDFRQSKKQNFFLQDAIIYLKTTKKKYDLIVVDVAGNIGIDERFISDEYFSLIKDHLKSKGIFVSNMPSSRNIKESKFSQDLIKKYKRHFEFLNLYNGETSNKIFYKTFFNIDEIILDITNLIIIASNKAQKLSKDYLKIQDLGIDIESYIKDKID